MTITTDAAGKIEQHIGYYPYGEPWREPSGQRATLFAGKERLSGQAAGDSDFGPRGYRPTIVYWDSPDKLAKKYAWTSPWSYCGGNPIRYNDRTGNEWTDINGKPILDLSKVEIYIFYIDDFKYQAKVQYNEAVKTNGAGAVAMSNTGTRSGFAKDWGNMSGNIQKVQILAHGRNQSINVSNKDGDAANQLTSTGDGKTNESGTEATNVQDLPHPKGNIENADLELYTCHSADESKTEGKGSLTGTKDTISKAFAKSFNFRSVSGTSGSVNYNINPFSKDFYKPYSTNGSWTVYMNQYNPTR